MFLHLDTSLSLSLSLHCHTVAVARLHQRLRTIIALKSYAICVLLSTSLPKVKIKKYHNEILSSMPNAQHSKTTITTTTTTKINGRRARHSYNVFENKFKFFFMAENRSVAAHVFKMKWNKIAFQRVSFSWRSIAMRQSSDIPICIYIFTDYRLTGHVARSN